MKLRVVTNADVAEVRELVFAVLVNSIGKISGCVGLLPVSSKTCELRKMYLVKDARGQGHGRRLLEHALSRAKELGFKRVELETASLLKDAINMYKRRGFKELPKCHVKVGRCDQAYALDFD